MATNDEIRRSALKAKRARANARALARECKVCREYRDKAGAHFVRTELSGLAYTAWLATGMEFLEAEELAIVTVVCYHTKEH